MVRKAQAPSRGRFPKESGEQVQLFKWAAQFNTLNTLLFAIPNGGGRHPAEAVHLRRQGVKPGVPDIFLPVPSVDGRFHGLFIELKRRKPRGRLSDEQAEFIRVLGYEGYRVQICYGWAEAAIEIVDYLDWNRDYLKEIARLDSLFLQSHGITPDVTSCRYLAGPVLNQSV